MRLRDDLGAKLHKRMTGEIRVADLDLAALKSPWNDAVATYGRIVEMER